ncbi:MAG TPA: peptide deformylase [Candidatus Copromorpha excrementigallinarum]|uniref:Peptide deformylase n=1 Tax=Candidatus Allocopromorpha excrementigallinarum TaxID=2840742 RepID=A0A9D1HZF5_9FIRM|nr:peptide deformylase [Candidatus Copromorpha excrementigallinarum]
MALRTIIQRGEEREDWLRKRSRPVDKVDDRIKTIMDDMVETMREAKGAGLAAPQVGILRRMFVAEPEPGKLYYFINPEIISSEGARDSEEGCLSVPGYGGVVERPERITIKGLDREGKEQEYTFEGFYASVMCHEYDHLDGILYTDKAKAVQELDSDEEE